MVDGFYCWCYCFEFCIMGVVFYDVFVEWVVFYFFFVVYDGKVRLFVLCM